MYLDGTLFGSGIVHTVWLLVQENVGKLYICSSVGL